jgi:hypothetical protein
MISFTKQDVTAALRKIDRVGVYKKNRSRTYCLVEKYHYPPKEVLRVAYLLKTGKPLKKLHGGSQTNTPLSGAGFNITKAHCGCGNTCKII